MNSKRFLILIIVFGMALLSLSAPADVVILKSGKKLKVEKVWQQNGQTWIVIDGMRARIPNAKVKRIESDSTRRSRNVDLKKDKSANIQKFSPRAPKTASRVKTEYASKSAVSPKPASIGQDQSRIFPNEKFGDLKWGTRLSAIHGLEKIKTAGAADDIAEYLLTKKDVKLGQIPLKSVHLAFWQDRLYMITLRTQGRPNYTALRDEMFSQFGPGHRAEQFYERYLWTDTPNDMMLDYSKDGQQGMLWLRSSEVDRQYKLSKLSRHASYLKWMKSRN